jgi:TetR/AcrR family transcriptional regulator, transcriptional repressor for nem operon
MATRDNIIDAADTLFYERGFEHTSFAHIADAVQISRGNFYHHFKSKDEILVAVIAARLERTQALLAQWERDGASPQERIGLFISILVRNQAKIMRHGCPVGTLCAELTKLGHHNRAEANAIMELFRTWLRGQFVLMGRAKDADALAMHLLARTQGVAVVAQSLRDKAFLQQEVQQMLGWLEDCQAPRAASVRRAH